MASDSATSSAAPVATDQLFSEALKCQQAGELERAAELYQSILQVIPTDPMANHNLGMVALQLEQHEAALHYFRVALDADPARGQFWLSYIDALHRTGKVADARQTLALARQQGLDGDAVDALEIGLLADLSKSRHEAASRAPKRRPHQEPGPKEMKVLTAAFSKGNAADLATRSLEMIRRYPRHWFGWKALGVAYQRAGRNSDALVPMQKTVELLSGDAEAHNNLGIVLQGLGRLADAEASYRRALQLAPKYAQAHGNLGVVLKLAGRLEEAAASCQFAIQLDPNYVKAYSNLGVIQHDLKRLEEAEATYRRALEVNPACEEVLNNLGITLNELGRPEEARACYSRALEIAPGFADALSNLGGLEFRSGGLVEAEANCQRALELEPDHVEALTTLGLVMVQFGRMDEAIKCFSRALQIRPGYATAHRYLGELHFSRGRHHDAIESFQAALAIDPSLVVVHIKLGVALYEVGRLSEAEASCRRALAISANSALAYNCLGNVLQDFQRQDEAADCFRRALEIDPDYAVAHSNLLLLANYSASLPPEQCLEQARQYGQRISMGATPKYGEWLCEHRPDRLRVGLVSGDFRSHPVGYFIESLVASLSTSNLDLIAIATGSRSDKLTDRIKPYFSKWKSIEKLDDKEAARRVRDERIHVLVDLSGHTGQNRLPVFAWKPAPVQVSWLGYFATTGVPEIDYLLGDSFVTPESESHHFAEEVWRLPETYLCFTKPAIELEVAPLPASATGHVTFGCFNNLGKMNDRVLEVWARILVAMPDARLFLKTKQLNEPMLQESMLRRFADHGIAAERLVLEGGSPRAELLAAYNRVDIALDPFPYPGGTTSVEGLWMGVPVITRRGDRFLSHVGETIAHNAGLSEWVASDADDYVAKAIRFGSDIEGLARLRSGLRQRVLASPIFDAERFASHFEQAMWAMWQRWQDKQGKS